MEMDDSVYARLTHLTELGNERYDAEAYASAIVIWQQAIELLPEPKSKWEAALWLHASIADAQFLQGNFEGARSSSFDALNCPDSLDNPLVLLRLGQASFELGMQTDALEYLTRAYMLEGAELFEAEMPAYLQLLKEHGVA